MKTGRSCIQYNYFNAHLLHPTGKVYYDCIEHNDMKKPVGKILLYSGNCNAI